MPDLKDSRKKVKITLAALVLLDVAAAAMLLSPLVGSERSRREEMKQLWKELQTKTREVEPLRGLDKKIAAARQQIEEFYKNRLPAQDSTISAEVGRLASQSGVKIGQVKYKPEDPEPVGLRPMEIDAELSGDYLQVVRFINALERDNLLFIIDSVELGGAQGGTVHLQMKLETYLKTGV
jgi:type IV pilus assembly protein PilO